MGQEEVYCNGNAWQVEEVFPCTKTQTSAFAFWQKWSAERGKGGIYFTLLNL